MINGLAEPFEIRTGRKGGTGAGNLYPVDPAAVARLKALETELAAQRKARAKARAAAVVQQYKRPRPVVDEVTDDVCVQTPDEGEAPEESTMPRRLKLTEKQLQDSYDRIAAGESAGKVAKDIPCGGPALLRHLRKAGYDMDFVTKRRGAGAVDFKVEQAEALSPPPAPPKPSQNGHVSIPTPEPVPEPEPTAVAVAEPVAALQLAGDVAGQLDALRQVMQLAQAGDVKVAGRVSVKLSIEFDF